MKKIEFSKNGNKYIVPLVGKNEGSIFYSGTPILINTIGWRKSALHLTPTNNTQAFAFDNGLMCVLTSNQGCYIYNDGKIVKSTTLPYGTHSQPHSNMASFGAETNGTHRYLYVSQWDVDKGCLVYSIDNNYDISLVQSIKPSADLLVEDYCGKGSVDWIVDANNKCLYSIGYRLNSNDYAEGNLTQICKFNLPYISVGNMNLSISDIVDKFSVDCLPRREDASINNGKIYLSNGHVGSNFVGARISVIDPFQKRIVSSIDLTKINGNFAIDTCEVYDGEIWCNLLTSSTGADLTTYILTPF